MTSSWLAGPGQILQRLSGGVLLFTIMAVAAATALVLSWSLLSESGMAERDRLNAIGIQLASVLEESGLGGLTQKLADIENASLAGVEAVEIAVWRLTPDSRRLHRATSAAAADALAALPPGTTAMVRIEGQDFQAQSPDLATLSAGWSIPMADVALVYALPSPGPGIISAWLTVSAVWAGLGVALIVGLLLHANHSRRYRDGLNEINARLERFSSGETTLRLSEDTPAPELRALAHRLNIVLPRIDELVTGLRYLSAHMAHEMKTPLQSIRGDLSRLLAAPDDAGRAGDAQAINQTIDLANARLHSLMQLFRLESMAPVPMTAGLDLSEIVDYAMDDLIDVLQTRGRKVTVAIEPGIAIHANKSLMELLVGNLLGNASKYAVPGAEILVSLRRGDGRFRLSVANTGSSFAPDIRASAFDRFSRGSTQQDIPGVGIGLALVNAIAQRHGFIAEIAPSDTVAEIVISGPCLDSRPAGSDPGAARNKD